MGGGGLRYAYDDASKLTSITDYDNSVLTYTYDASGNVLTMDDYHSNDTTYTYTDTNQLSTITAPGSKVWDYDYNAIGQPTQYEHPNGMDTVYSYDGRNRLTKIEHKDGVTVLDSFAYVLDDVGNVDSVEQVDGSVWDYLYDGRYRLTKAVRDNAQTSPTISATYEYSYDNGDNLLTKVHPFEDAFDDANYTGWSATSGTWSAANGYAEKSGTPLGDLRLATTDADTSFWFRYYRDSSSDASSFAMVYLRSDGNKVVRLIIQTSQLKIDEIDNGVGATLDTETSADTSNNTWYNYHVEMDGADITVWRGTDDGSMDKVLETTAASVITTDEYIFTLRANNYGRFDNVRAVADDLDSTTTYVYNGANELTTMTQPDGSDIDFEYDLWGRMTKKELGTTYEATYGYRYDHKLVDVTTDWPRENDVEYDYGGDGKRRERSAGGDTSKFNWGHKYSVISEENSSGVLTRTYIESTNAHVDGTSPSTGDYVYYTHDGIHSSRATYDEDNNQSGVYEYTPYGEQFVASDSQSVTHRFTGHELDSATRMYYTLFRFYHAGSNRWMTQDPLHLLDGPNVYSYMGSNPTNGWDSLGLLGYKPSDNPKTEFYSCKRPLRIDGLDKLYPLPPFYHQYIELPDGSGIDRSMDEDHPIPKGGKGKKTQLRRRKNGKLPDGTSCSKASNSQIADCIRSTRPSHPNTGKNLNCQKWTRHAIGKCCLRS